MSVKEIVVLSGKGGTGKTTLTSCLAAMAGGKAVIADTDVDAPNLWIPLHPENDSDEPFHGMDVAMVDQSKCIGCGRCLRTCRFDAIAFENNVARVDTGFCEGCAACTMVCPVPNCITMDKVEKGRVYHGVTPYGPMWHARLNPGGENSGMLVAQLRADARREAEEKGYGLLLVDGPPGLACPAISAMTGVDLAVVVTEPTPSGWHDLKRLSEVTSRFKVPIGVVINKTDLAPEQAQRMRDACREEGFAIFGELPFNRRAAEELADRRIPLDQLREPLEAAWSAIRERVGLEEA
ncbi:MAG: ATP-binding protein [Synergistales bacterium]|nr:ATP-binding protein [Synergistales bacterium]